MTNSVYSKLEFTLLPDEEHYSSSNNGILPTRKDGYRRFQVRGSLQDSKTLDVAGVDTLYWQAIPNTGDVSSDPIDPSFPHVVIWMLNPDLDEFNSTNASFWIEITDDDPSSELLVARIKARMWTGQTDDRTGRSTNIFPSENVRIIPIGIVTPRLGIYVGVGDAADLVPKSFIDS